MAEESTRPGRRTFASVIRSHLVILIVLSLLGAAAGWTMGTRKSRSSTASASILLNPLDGNPFSPEGRGDSLINLKTEAELVRSDAVASQVITQLPNHDLTPGQMLSGLKVTAPENTQILIIDYTAPSGQVAIARTQAFADAFLASRRARAAQFVSDRTAKVAGQVKSRTEDMNRLEQRLKTSRANSASATLLNEQIKSLSSQIDLLTIRSISLDSGSLNPGQIITPAATPHASIIDARVLLALAGFVAGLALALAAVALRVRSGSRVNHIEDVTDLGLTVIGTIASEDLMTSTDPTGPLDSHVLSDDYRRVRGTLLNIIRERPCSVLLSSVSQPMSAPGSAAGLALSLARAHISTIVLDATTTLVGEAGTLAQTGRVGLTDILQDLVDPQAALLVSSPYLSIVGRGTIDHDSADLFTYPEMADLVRTYKNYADVVLVVSGPIQDGNSMALARAVDHVLLETVDGSTRRQDLSRAAAECANLSSEFMGALHVLRPARRSRRPLSTRRHQRGAWTPDQPESRHSQHLKKLTRANNNRRGATSKGSSSQRLSSTLHSTRQEKLPKSAKSPKWHRQSNSEPGSVEEVRSEEWSQR